MAWLVGIIIEATTCLESICCHRDSPFLGGVAGMQERCRRCCLPMNQVRETGRKCATTTCVCDRSDSGYLAISRLDVCVSRWVSMCLPQARHIEKLCMFYVDRGLQDNGNTDDEAQRLCLDTHLKTSHHERYACRTPCWPGSTSAASLLRTKGVLRIMQN